MTENEVETIQPTPNWDTLTDGLNPVAKDMIQNVQPSPNPRLVGIRQFITDAEVARDGRFTKAFGSENTRLQSQLNSPANEGFTLNIKPSGPIILRSYGQSGEYLHGQGKGRE